MKNASDWASSDAKGSGSAGPPDSTTGAGEDESLRPRAEFRRFIGVDLGGGRGKNTAVARLELTRTAQGRPRLAVTEAKTRYGQRGTGLGGDEPGGDALFRDEVLVDYLERWVDDTTVVAMHAPLTLPPCIRCTLPCPTVERCEVPVVVWMRTWAPRLASRGRSDPGKPAVTPYTQRATEILQQASGVRMPESLGQGTGPLAARASHLRRIISSDLRLHENLLEVDPRATLTRTFGAALERKARHGASEDVWAVRKSMLQGLADNLAFDYVWPELVVRNVRVFHAVICAFTAFAWATQRWQGPRDLAPPGDSGESEQGADDVVERAARALGELWVEDGWIWMPPPTPTKSSSS